MLHEIQPGDVVIVTIHGDKDSGELCGAMLKGLCKNFQVIASTAPIETSVHVIRANKAEDTPKPDWPAWRDVKKEPPPMLDRVGSNVMVMIYADFAFVIGYFCNGSAYNNQGKLVPNVTHWMPLPEGPKS